MKARPKSRSPRTKGGTSRWRRGLAVSAALFAVSVTALAATASAGFLKPQAAPAESAAVLQIDERAEMRAERKTHAQLTCEAVPETAPAQTYKGTARTTQYAGRTGNVPEMQNERRYVPADVSEQETVVPPEMSDETENIVPEEEIWTETWENTDEWDDGSLRAEWQDDYGFYDQYGEWHDWVDSYGFYTEDLVWHPWSNEYGYYDSSFTWWAWDEVWDETYEDDGRPDDMPEEDDSWQQEEQQAWQEPSGDLYSNVAALAESCVGVTPYVWASHSLIDGADCSGFVWALYYACGYDLGTWSSDAMLGIGYEVSIDEAIPGDIVVYYGGGHVGIYMGNGWIIHSPRPGYYVEWAPVSLGSGWTSIRHVW